MSPLDPTLERLSGRAWYQALADREFSPDAATPPSGLSRREFVSLLGASLALAGLGACVRAPDEKILQYIDIPDGVTPGVPLHYATAMSIDGYATGVLVTSNDGRPTKIEGNPAHPASLGAAGIFEQASVLQLYDPHRARHVRVGNRRGNWNAARAAFTPGSLSKRAGAGGAGLALLLEPTSSPLIENLLGRVRERYPDARVYFHSPLAPASQSRDESSRHLIPHHDFRRADVVVSLDSDFLASEPFHLRYARDFSDRRRRSPINLLHVAEPSPSPTGKVAKYRVAAAPDAIGRMTAALFSAVAAGSPGDSLAPADLDLHGIPLSQPERDWVAKAAIDLIAHRGRGVVIAGARQPADVHTIVHALNGVLDNLGSTVWYTRSPLVEAGPNSSNMNAFARDIRSGDLDTLVVLEGNLCYAMPAEADMARTIRAVPNTVYLGAYDDETARVTGWHIPAAHYLESWGDTRAYDGTLSIVQPLIAPLYGGRTPAEILAVLAGGDAPSQHDLLQAEWISRRSGSSSSWDDALRRGVVDGSSSPRVTREVNRGATTAALRALARSGESSGEVVVSFVPSRTVYDGRFANNAWLQELPDPVTRLTWDNCAMVSPDLASNLGLVSGDEIEVKSTDRSIELPAVIVPGQAHNTITIAIGAGRGGAEAVARGVGTNVSVLRSVLAPFGGFAVAVRRTGVHRELALAQSNLSLEGRRNEILGPSEGAAEQTPGPTIRRRPLTLYEPPAASVSGYGRDQWAMTIDLDVCTGCSACVVACQAENNIPVVGREGVKEGREMHWIRVDRYIDGPPEAPRIEAQPMLCQHCEKAPCEYVCPVNATVHSDDGLNEMVYNRCVGTRFCSNNCPYKVRRFNWFDYNAELAETEKMAKNPEVTVRARGVMEKCTFCVQRIRHAQMDAELAGNEQTGQVLTACQQTCPTNAIVFGSLTDAGSEVVRLFNDPRSFSALEELGTVPRVRYLASRNGDE